MSVLGLWLTYGAAAAAAVWLARRSAGGVSVRAGVLLALLPLVFTGKAMLLGRLYGPADLYAAGDPWRAVAGASGSGAPRNPILSDLAFANLPWRAAVRDAVVNGRAPLWNRFVLGGTPLLGAAQAGVFHPSTWFGLWLPVSLSWTFSCTFTLFLALLAAYVFFRDFALSERAALVGAVGWGFSTYLVFWDGWSVGPSTATFPLLLLGLRRLARGASGGGVGLTAAALCLSLFGGHPESFFHGVAAGGVYFLWELAARARRDAARAIGGALAAGALAVLLGGPQLFPLLEAIPHSAEYRARRAALGSGASRQSVPAGEAASRLLPDLLPFAHGIYGQSAVDTRRDDGSGMPLGYAGAVLFAPALLALFEKPRARGRAIFLAFLLAGLAYGASAPGLLDATSRLPGFAFALNYRLVFLSGLGLAGLAAFGTESLCAPGAWRRLAAACAGVLGVIAAAFLCAGQVFADRGLGAAFVRRSLLVEVAPVAALALAAAAAAARRRPRLAADAAIVCLVAQRFLEMGGTYPTLSAESLAPALPTLAALPIGSDPSRLAAAGDVFRPNAAALYGVEDARGYESLVLDRFADTYPLWCRPQAASFNRVDDLGRPFLGFLNVRYALGAPGDPAPAGWTEQARGPELAIFSNPRALPRAFAPRALRTTPDALAALAAANDFSEIAFLPGAAASDGPNGTAALRVRETGPDLVVEVSASSRTFVATSLPDWPGWTAAENGRPLPITTVNHAFVGFWSEPGEHAVRLRYRPRSWTVGLWAFAAGLAASAGLAAARRARLTATASRRAS
jgi:hypothetical protein